MYAVTTPCVWAVAAQPAQVVHQDLEQQHPSEPMDLVYQDLPLLRMAAVHCQVVARQAVMLDPTAAWSHIGRPLC